MTYLFLIRSSRHADTAARIAVHKAIFHLCCIVSRKKTIVTFIHCLGSQDKNQIVVRNCLGPKTRAVTMFCIHIQILQVRIWLTLRVQPSSSLISALENLKSTKIARRIRMPGMEGKMRKRMTRTPTISPQSWLPVQQLKIATKHLRKFLSQLKKPIARNNYKRFPGLLYATRKSLIWISFAPIIFFTPQ